MKKYLVWIFCFLTIGLIVNMSFAATLQQPLPEAQAFKLSAKLISQHQIILNWDIAPGTFLYADRLQVQMQKPEEKILTNILLPKNAIKITTTDHKQESIYKHQLSFAINLPVNQTGHYQFSVRYQGCSDSGYCYPPHKKIISIDDNVVQITATTASMSQPWLQQQKQLLTEPDRIITIFSNQSIFILILSFFLFGLLLSLTPCVLPMVPILSNIILGQRREISTKQGFLLSLSYVLGMSLTYATLGILAALLGYSLQAVFQNPWVLSVFAGIFVLLSLASFGVYQLQPPQWFRHFLSKQSTSPSKQHTFVSVAAMGAVSSVVVSPCVTAPFIGALAYISQSGNIILGGIALFVLGLGMGVPLLVTGIAGGKLLPHAGAWMEKIKALFGILLLFVAVELISRFANPTISNVLWALTCFLGAILFFRTKDLKKLMSRLIWRVLALAFLLFGIYFLLQINSVKNIISPYVSSDSDFSMMDVRNFSQLQTQLEIAKQQNKPVILDFYADWCRSCKDMEQTTFQTPEVKSILKYFKMIRVNISANDHDAQVLMQHYQVIAPPVLIFLSSNGNEIPKNRIIGEIDAFSFKKFTQNVCNLKQMFACLNK